MKPPEFAKLSDDQLDTIDAVCDLFEGALSRGEATRIEEYLGRVEADLRAPLLRELIAAELACQYDRGTTPIRADFESRFPDSIEVVQAAFADSPAGVSIENTRVVDGDDTVSRMNRDSPQTPAAFPNEAALPQGFGRYRLLKLLGQGGMGAVYLAHDAQLDREVALKLPKLSESSTVSSEAIARFYREARSMANVSHSNLCTIHDVGEHDGCHYLTMAYIKGPTLAEVLRAEGPMDARSACDLVRQLALAVVAIHEADILHRDLKPSNVMINEDGIPFITDFGLALRDDQGEAELTQSGALIGSPAYMAPEQVGRNRNDLGPPTDIYALGVILYELLCGRRPYQGDALDILCELSSGTKPDPPSRWGSDISADAEAICMTAMSHSPAKRYQSANDLVGELQRFLDGHSIRSASLLGLPRLLSYCLIFIAAVFTIVGAIAFNRPTHLTPSPQGEGGQNARVQTASPAKELGPPPNFELTENLLHVDLPTNNSGLGSSIVADGNTAVVGAPSAFGSSVRTGAAYVLDFPAGSGPPVCTATLLPDEPGRQHTLFGTSVDICNNQIIVAARHRVQHLYGSAYIFEKQGDEWVKQAYLEAPGKQAGRSYGFAAAISDDYAAVQAIQNDQEIVHLYSSTSGSWEHQQTLAAGDHLTVFGRSLSMNGTRLAATNCVRLKNLQMRVMVIVYELRDDRWEVEQEILVREAVETGAAPQVLLQGDRLLVGLPRDTVGTNTCAGSVEVYSFRGNEWQLDQKLTIANADTDDGFGSGLALDGDRLIVSSIKHQGMPNSGGVFLFREKAGGWELVGEPSRSVQPALQDQFGRQLAVIGKRLLVGAPRGDQGHGIVHLNNIEDGITSAGVWRPVVKPQSLLVEEARMGWAIGIVEDKLLASAPKAGLGNLKRAGVIHLFSQDGSYVESLRSPQPTADEQFGECVVYQSPSLIVATGRNAKQNFVRVFAKREGHWEWQQDILGDDEEYYFGHTMALGDNLLAITSAPPQRRGDDPRRESDYWYVHLFQRVDDVWKPLQRIQAKDAVANDGFGIALALRDDLLLIGAPSASPVGKHSGAAYLFQFNGSQWRQIEKFTASDGAFAAAFGQSVALGGDLLAIGAPGAKTFGNNSGAVYAFHRRDGGWSQHPEPLFAFDASAGSSFGASLAIWQNRLLIGSTGEGSLDTGAAYLFYYDNTSWQQHQKLTTPYKIYNQKLGQNVTMNGTTILVSARTGANEPGSVFVFRPESLENEATVDGN